MRQKQVIFNLDKRTIGFVSANCSHDHNELLVPLPPKNETKTGTNEKVPMKLKHYKWIIIGGILGGVMILGVLVVCVRKCRRNRNATSQRQYANLEVKTPPDSVVVLHDSSHSNSVRNSAPAPPVIATGEPVAKPLAGSTT